MSSPRIFASTALFAVCGTGYFLGLKSLPPHSVPRLTSKNAPMPVEATGGFIPARLDLGRIPWNDKVEFQLTFVNGSHPITIRSVQSSCDCTVVEAGRYRGVILAPHGSLSIDAMMNSGTSPGPKRRRITMYDEDGGVWASDVDIFVEASWSLLPAVVDLGDVVFDAGDTAISSFATFSSEADELISIDDPGVPWLTTRVSDGRRTGTREILLTNRKDQLTPGVQSASVLIQTSSLVKPSGAIYVKLRAIHDRTSLPPAPTVIGRTPVRVEFFDRTGARVRIVSAVCDSPHIQVANDDSGAVSFKNPGGAASPEPVQVDIVDSQGRSRRMLIPVL